MAIAPPHNNGVDKLPAVVVDVTTDECSLSSDMKMEAPYLFMSRNEEILSCVSSVSGCCPSKGLHSAL
jgi:hypothetical protein